MQVGCCFRLNSKFTGAVASLAFVFSTENALASGTEVKKETCPLLQDQIAKLILHSGLQEKQSPDLSISSMKIIEFSDQSLEF